jgi:hypothetical protein
VLRGAGSGGVAADGTVTAASLLVPDGTAGSPGWQWASDNDGSGTGMYRRSADMLSFSAAGTGVMEVNSSAILGLISTGGIGFKSGAITTSGDTIMSRAAANSFQFGGSTATTTARTELNKSVTAITDAALTAVLTITIPNAAHSASLLVRVTGSLGAGGAIGANEATATNSYIISLTRTAGVNATAAISAAFGAAATAVAGAATVTCTAAMSAVAGAVGASNTFTVNVTISRSAGSSTNHTCLVYAQLMNANVTGVTIA